MKRNDKGFSLIELIVVIAMMAVAMVVGGMALSNITLANAKKCATEIKSTLEYARMESLRSSSGDSLAVTIYENNEGSVMIQFGANEKKEIASSSVSIRYIDEQNEEQNLSNGGVLKFVFDRGSGAFKEMDAKKIIVSGAGKEHTITCYSKTGKVAFE